MVTRSTTPRFPARRRLRWKDHDYRAAAAYFVTIVAKDRACVFGTIQDGMILATDAGEAVLECWLQIPGRHPRAAIDRVVLMPNHLHGIVVLLPGDSPGPSLSSVIAAFKAATTRRSGFAPGTLWQRGFNDRVLRDAEEWDAAAAYIAANPSRWNSDRENPSQPPLNGHRSG